MADPYSIASLIQQHARDETARRPFELENSYLLEVNLDGRVWAKVGTMVAYLGNVKFTREGVLDRGVGTMLKKMASGEGAALMRMDGQGRVYLAEAGKRIHVVDLGGEVVFVNGNDLLALQDGVEWAVGLSR